MRKKRLGAILAVLAGAAAFPAAALGQQQSNPFSPGLPQSTPTVTTSATPTVALPSTSTTTSSNSGLSGTGALAIGVGAIVILGGISLFIWRDARRRAPVHHHKPVAEVPGSKRKPKPRKLSAAERRRRKRGRAR